MRPEASIGEATISFNLACHSGKSAALILAAPSNRVCALKKLKATVPTGPSRCLVISKFTKAASCSRHDLPRSFVFTAGQFVE